MLGCLLAISIQQRHCLLPTSFAKWASWVGALLVAIGLAVTTPAMVYPSGWALLPTLGAVMLIASPNAVLNRKILASKPLVKIGLISYPLYLWHWTLLSFVTIIAGGVATTELKWLVLTLSFLLSWLTYRWIEQPIKRAQHRSVSWGLLFGLIFMGYLGFNVYDRKGYDFREKGILRSAAAYEPQRQEDCLQKFQSFKLTFCRITDSAKSFDVVLLGDSHANQYWRGFTNQAQAQGLNALNVGWAGMDVVYLPNLVNKKTDQHGRAVDELMLEITSTPSVRHVVLSAAQRSDWTPQYEAGLRNVIELMLQANKRVTYILDNPPLSFHPVSCVGMPPLRPRTNAACSMPVKNIASHYFAVREQIKGLLAKYPNVQIIDTYPFVCDAIYCQIQREQRLLYENTHYFSPIGSVAVFESLPVSW